MARTRSTIAGEGVFEAKAVNFWLSAFANFDSEMALSINSPVFFDEMLIVFEFKCQGYIEGQTIEMKLDFR
jgi:hypothetical protein